MTINDKRFQQSTQLIHRETKYSGYHQIDVLDLKYPLFEGGFSAPITHEVIVRKDVVAVLLFDAKLHQFVFVEQFRTGVYCRTLDETTTAHHNAPWTLEITAGDVETKESLESVAKRETFEETGLTLEALIPIYEYWVSPANQSGKMAIFLGRIDSKKAKGVHGVKSENEDIRLQTLSLTKAYEYLENGKITYAPAIIALQWFKLNEKKVYDLWGDTTTE